MQNHKSFFPSNLTISLSWKRITAKNHADAWFVTGTILIVLFITSLPYLYGFLSTPADKKFMGIMLDVPDHAQYFSWLRDFSTANLISNKLTPEYNRPIFFNLLWWGMAQIGQVFNLDYIVLYQTLRIISTAL
ncbi:MAG: hypothetical protein IH585_07105, partial [Anaerolineaceae bacterium]|nr:hypothetical protein [Anaerolineaceae bacterium]